MRLRPLVLTSANHLTWSRSTNTVALSSPGNQEQRLIAKERDHENLDRSGWWGLIHRQAILI